MSYETVYASVVTKSTACIGYCLDIRKQVRSIRAATRTAWFGEKSKVSYAEVFPELAVSADEAIKMVDTIQPFLEAWVEQVSAGVDETWLRRWQPDIDILLKMLEIVDEDVRAWLSTAIKAFSAKNKGVAENWYRIRWPEYQANLSATYAAGTKIAGKVLDSGLKLQAQVVQAATKVATVSAAAAGQGFLQGVIYWAKANPLMVAGLVLVGYYLWTSGILKQSSRDISSGIKSGLATGSKAATGQVSI